MKPLSQRLTERELISRGDLTLAYRARDGVLDRPVFVKILNPALAQDQEIRARFEREAKAVARLDHPNLVRIYEYGEDPSEGLFMLLEWFAGRTLTAELKTGTRYAGKDFSDLAAQLLKGLAALHSVGVLHRDLKPDNILLKEGGTCKITDFSLAALRDAPKLTHHEAIVGTPAYMSPEQAAGAIPDERSDLFALGTVLYEAATGSNPFASGNLMETLRNVRETEVFCDEKSLPQLSETSRELIHRLLAKNPDDRFFTANEALANVGETPLPALPEPRSPKRDFQHLAVALALIGIWAFVMFVWKPWKETKPALSAKIAVEKAADSATAPVTQTMTDTTHSQTDVAISEPELRAPTEENKDHKIAANTKQNDSAAEKSNIKPDSANVFLTTEPWAYIYFNGTQVGTTPLDKPLRLPQGKQTLVLRNPAFPPVPVTLDVSGSDVRQMIALGERVALLKVAVAPWGELYVDGEHVGTTPLPHPLYLAPGKHTLRASHPQYPAVQRDVSVDAGEVFALDVDFTQGSAAVKAQGKNSR